MLFPAADHLRRMQGAWLEAIGYGGEPAPSWIAVEMPGMRLRAFAGRTDPAFPPLILIPAPIKRAYIYDLVPRASVVRRCLAAGRAVFLLEWVEPDRISAGFGLADYADRLISAAREAVELASGHSSAVLVGHSLGGTLAAIHAARRPQDVAALALLESPLVFDPKVDAFAPWLRVPPSARRLFAGASTVPGSELSLAAVAAAPEAFLWHRWGDACASFGDPERRDLHLRVLRWALDEMALPAPLLRDVLQCLYRENRLRDGRLEISGRTIGLSGIEAPVLAVVERGSRVVPEAEVLPALATTSSPRREVLTYDGDAGVALAHVGVLVGQEAHRRLWPQILDWLREAVSSAPGPRPRPARRTPPRPRNRR
jgi:polyhydroxyalkanoate synthase